MHRRNLIKSAIAVAVAAVASKKSTASDAGVLNQSPSIEPQRVEFKFNLGENVISTQSGAAARSGPLRGKEQTGVITSRSENAEGRQCYWLMFSTTSGLCVYDDDIRSTLNPAYIAERVPCRFKYEVGQNLVCISPDTKKMVTSFDDHTKNIRGHECHVKERTEYLDGRISYEVYAGLWPLPEGIVRNDACCFQERDLKAIQS